MIANVMEISLNDFIEDALRIERELKEASLLITRRDHSQYNYSHSQTVCTQNHHNCSDGHHQSLGICPQVGCYNSMGHTDIGCNITSCTESYNLIHTPMCNNVTYGFNHENYIPSIPYIYNEAQRTGKPLRDTAIINVFSYDGNLQDKLGTQDAQSNDIHFSVELRKLSNFDGSPVSVADANWHYVGNFRRSPLRDGQSVTHSPIAAQRADNNGMASFTIDTRNPFGKATFDYRSEEGIYQLRVVAWNTYLSAHGVTKYYISSTRFETLEFRQNFIPEVVLTNESNIRNFIFSNHGVKTDAPAFKAWKDDVYRNDYASAQNQTEGIFVRFSMRDLDSEEISIANWQTGKAYLRRSNGTEIAQTDVWFSEDASKGDTITQSDGNWKTGYAYFGNWLFPESIDLTDCTVTIEITDYYNAACTDAIGTYNLATTVLDIDTKIPALLNVTQSTPGLNTSTVKPGVGIVNSVYAMRMRVNYSDSHPRTDILSVQYAITNTDEFPSLLIPVTVDDDGYFVTPEITKNGTYYVHIYVQDYAGNSHKATYGPYTRMFESEFVGGGSGDGDIDGGSGIYISEMKSAGKTHIFGADTINSIKDLGLPLSDGSKLSHRQGYAFILRIAVRNTDAVNLQLMYGDKTIPVHFLGYRKFEVPDSATAIVPSFIDAGSVAVNTLTVDGIMPDALVDPDGHIVSDTESVYVAEFQVYLHRDIVFDAGSSNTNKTLNISVKLTGQQVYPTGHPLAGQKVFTEATLEDVLIIDNNVIIDGGTNDTN